MVHVIYTKLFLILNKKNTTGQNVLSLIKKKISVLKFRIVQVDFTIFKFFLIKLVKF